MNIFAVCHFVVSVYEILPGRYLALFLFYLSKNVLPLSQKHRQSIIISSRNQNNRIICVKICYWRRQQKIKITVESEADSGEGSN